MPVGQQNYEIRVKGHLDPCWGDWLAGLQMTHLDNGDTLLAGQLPDQTALHGVLERFRDLNIELISVICKPAAAPAGQ